MRAFLFLLVTLSIFRNSTADSLPTILTHLAESQVQDQSKHAISIQTLIEDQNSMTAENVTNPPSSFPAIPAHPSSNQKGNSKSRKAIGCLMTIVIGFIITWAVFVFRADIVAGVKKCGAKRTSENDQQEGALNDIIFDPAGDEETNARLSRALLTDIV